MSVGKSLRWTAVAVVVMATAMRGNRREALLKLSSDGQRAHGPACTHYLYTYSLYTEGANLQPAPQPQRSGVNVSAAAVGPVNPLLEMSFRLGAASRYMPIISAQSSTGMTHQVLKTETLLKYLAFLNERLEALQCNSGGADGSPMKPLDQWIFAHPHMAIRWAAAHADEAASSNSSDALAAAVAATLSCARCDSQHLFRKAPPSTLLHVPGMPVAAVADILSVKLLPVPDGSANGDAVVSLTLSVVSQPHTINEFDKHPGQTLDDDAHYHFYTPAYSSTKVNATAFLVSLLGSADPRDWSAEAAAATIPELHLFIKGGPDCPSVTNTSLTPYVPANYSRCVPPSSITYTGQRCNGTCLAGFVPAPTAPTIQCYSNGSVFNWTLVSGGCTPFVPVAPADCTSNPSTTPQGATWPPGGCLGAASSVPSGTQCKATCNTGYTGNPYYSCTNGSWVPGPTGCLPNPCPGNPSTPAPAGSSWPASCGVFGQSAQSGSSCTATCNSGFSPAPSAPSAVCSLGVWGAVTGACAPSRCSSLPTAAVPGGGNWPSSCNDTASNATCTGVCAAGLTGAPVTACFAGAWQPVQGPACVNCSTDLVAVTGSSQCLGAAALTASFKLTAANVAQASFAATIDGIPCNTPPALTGPQPAGATVTVTCPAPVGGFSVGSHIITLTATSTGANGTACTTATKTASATAAIRPAPAITSLSVAAQPAPGCKPSAGAAPQQQTLKASFQYAVAPGPDNGPLVLSATASGSAGATCTISSPSAALGVLEVLCSASFAAATTAVDISVTLVASQGSCAQPVASTASVTVPFVCCTAPGTRSTFVSTATKCKDCGNSVTHYTQGPGSGTLFTGLSGETGCPTRLANPPDGAVAVGTLDVSCSATGNAILFSVAAPPFSKLSASFLVRCDEINIRQCPAPSFTRVPVPSNNPSWNVVYVSNADGAKLSWQKVLTPPLGGCLCQDAFIAVTVNGPFYNVGTC